MLSCGCGLCCDTVVMLLWRCCNTVVMLLFRCCGAVVLLWRRCLYCTFRFCVTQKPASSEAVLEQLFIKHAGSDGVVDYRELTALLNEAFYKGTCTSLLWRPSVFNITPGKYTQR